MSNKLFQNIVHRIKHAINYDFGITDSSGLVIASSINEEINTYIEQCADFINTNSNYFFVDDISMCRVATNGNTEFVAYLKSGDENNKKYLDLIAISIESIKLYYDDKYDKESFVKNIVLGNILPGDIRIRSKELHVKYDIKRVAYLIKTESTKELFAYNVVKSLFPDTSKDFVILVDDENTVLIKELKDNVTNEEITKKANIIIDTLNSEIMVKASIGIGTVVNNIRDIAKSYKEAQTALLIGKIFENDRHILNYNHLGIGRLIYQLPTTLCKLFLKEVFKEGSFEAIDQETMLTIQKFFENNLNVSETSRQLFIHRNTLVYRLDKILKMTGMDLRSFDDAIYFKVAMMVKRYLDEAQR